MSGWWEVPISLKVEWSFATVTNGEQSVVIGGGQMMPESSADSLA